MLAFLPDVSRNVRKLSSKPRLSLWFVWATNFLSCMSSLLLTGNINVIRFGHQLACKALFLSDSPVSQVWGKNAAYGCRGSPQFLWHIFKVIWRSRNSSASTASVYMSLITWCLWSMWSFVVSDGVLTFAKPYCPFLTVLGARTCSWKASTRAMWISSACVPLREVLILMDALCSSTVTPVMTETTPSFRTNWIVFPKLNAAETYASYTLDVTNWHYSTEWQAANWPSYPTN